MFDNPAFVFYIHAALDGVASAWKQINDQKGHDKQLAAYKASLNIGATR